MIKTAQELIEAPHPIRPHVVLLGAGASRAAFSKGDATGRTVPLMDELVSAINLQPPLDNVGQEIKREANFEVVYSQIAEQPAYKHLKEEIERRINEYFSNLSLPPDVTIYDRILVSLRPTDAVFTFNWDPFLFDAYQRNVNAVPLPEIFFLHGNVRIGACREHDRWGARNGRCPDCSQRFADVPLLYPIRKKNYSADSYIRRNWKAARILFKDAFTMTIFGYGAPDSDVDAIKLLRQAWIAESKREFEHIEIIDTADSTCLHDRWSTFTPTHHYRIKKTFEQSRIARWPRRTCESLFYAMTRGMVCEDFPLPTTNSILELQTYAVEIAKHE